MALETELKYPVDSLLGLRRQLIAEDEASLLGEYFESNQIFDWPDRRLLSRQRLLRLRQADRSVLCLKSRPQREQPGLKAWVEKQTEVGSARETRALLQGLGLHPVLEYEKIRSKWAWGVCRVCLDRVPFGRYVEIEGPAKMIRALATRLGLEHPITDSYHELNSKLRREGLDASFTSFVFPGPEREQLMQCCAKNRMEYCL
jgi:adenylate cyclase class 2